MPMAGGTFTKQAVAGIAIGIVIAAASIGAWILYADSGDNDAGSAAQIVISDPIDAIESEASFHPPAIRVLLDKNSTVMWTNRSGTSVSLQRSEGLFDAVISPGGNFSFTFDRPGIYEYFAKESGKIATVVVSTAAAEEHKMVPVSLSKGPVDDVYREMAETIAAAADPQDRVKEIRLNNTRMMIYVTEAGADIRMPKSMCDTCVQSDRYDTIRYRTKAATFSGLNP